MATLTIRPNRDISVGHTKYNNGTSARTGSAYSFIDEEVSDEAATTIGQRHHSTDVTSKTSSFGLGGTTYNHAFFINSVTLYFDYWCNNPTSKGNMTSIAISASITANGEKSEKIKNSIANVNAGNDSGSWKKLNCVFTPSTLSSLGGMHNSISELDFQFELTTEWRCSSSNVSSDQQLYISQVYAVIDYTNVYMCVAVGNENTDATGPGYVKDGDEAVFEATPHMNYRFEGWYSNSGLTNLVSSAQTYSQTVSGEDITLYANSRKIEAINVYIKKNGQWVKATNIYLKQNGRFTTITAQEFGNQLYFSDRSYLKI